MLAHLRTEAYPIYKQHVYPPAQPGAGSLSYERNNELIEASKRALGSARDLNREPVNLEP
jgi:hypothetical protein